MDLQASAEFSERDEKITSPWSIPHVFGPNTRVLEVTLCSGKKQHATQVTRLPARWARVMSTKKHFKFLRIQRIPARKYLFTSLMYLPNLGWALEMELASETDFMLFDRCENKRIAPGKTCLEMCV